MGPSLFKATDADNNSFRFLDLPGELQNAIYKFYLSNITDYPEVLCKGQHEGSRCKYAPLWEYPVGYYVPFAPYEKHADADAAPRCKDRLFRKIRTEPALVQVCKKIRRDALSLFFREDLFLELNYSYLARASDQATDVQNWSRSVDASLVHRIRRLRVSILCMYITIIDGHRPKFKDCSHAHGPLDISMSDDGMVVKVHASYALSERQTAPIQSRVDRLVREAEGRALNGQHLVELASFLENVVVNNPLVITWSHDDRDFNKESKVVIARGTVAVEQQHSLD